MPDKQETRLHYTGKQNIVLILGYYGNKGYGKRVHWIKVNEEQTSNFIWNYDLPHYVKELKEEGHQVTIVN